MKKLTLLLIVLLALPLAFADPLDDADYITVVTESGGPTEVIAAANYASNMRIYGYKFTGAIDTTVSGIKDVNEKFLIYFNGKKAIIVDGIDNNHAVVRSQQYLESQGYTVEFGVPGEMLSELEEEEEETIPEQMYAVPKDLCEGCRFGEQCLVQGTRADGQYCTLDNKMVRQKATGEPCVYRYECWSNDCRGTCYDKDAVPEVADVEPPKQGFVKRFVGWFKGLFS